MSDLKALADQRSTRARGENVNTRALAAVEAALTALAAAIVIAVWMMLTASSVRADVAVSSNGCNIVLRHPGATGVTIAYDDPSLPIEDPYQITDGSGTINMLADYGIVYAAGSYTATWNDGTVEHFTLTCPSDYDPTVDPSAPPVTFSGPPIPDLPPLAPQPAPHAPVAI